MLTQDFDLSLINFEKNLLLNSLKSNNSIYKYKRCVYSPLRYAGGKSLAVGYIIELLPDKIKRLVSPFLGGGSLEIFISKELKIPVIANDIFDILINYWEYQINHPMDLYNELIKIEPTKESYTLIKNELKKTWDKVNGSNNYLNSLKKAAYYYFNHNLSYGPGFLGWMSSNYLNKKKYLSLLERVRNFSVSNFKVYSQSFEDFLIRYKHDFLYSDPPYYLYNDSKMFKGIYPMRNFPIHHNNFNHELLFEILKIIRVNLYCRIMIVLG